MKITAYGERNSGCFWYRTKMIFDALKRKGIDTNVADQNDIPNPSMTMIQMARGYSPGYEDFIFPVKYNKIKLWYDVDDAMDLTDLNNPFSYEVNKNLGSYYFMLNQADLVTCTNETLAEHLRTITPKPVFVFPNYLNPTEWVERPHGNEGPLRVGFVGSVSHVADLNMMLPALIRLQDRYDFKFVIMGFHPKDEKDFFRHYYDQLKGKGELYDQLKIFEKLLGQIKKLEWHPAAHWVSYSRRLAKLDLDLGLCPLLDTPFNKCKSAIKFYEYAISGTPALTSKVEVFKESGTPVENTEQDWYEAIDAMLMHDELRASTLAMQKAVVARKNIDLHIDALVDKLKSI